MKKSFFYSVEQKKKYIYIRRKPNICNKRLAYKELYSYSHINKVINLKLMVKRNKDAKNNKIQAHVPSDFIKKKKNAVCICCSHKIKRTAH